MNQSIDNFKKHYASGIGLIVLFLLVAVAVAVFITSGSMTSQYEFLEKESFETEYGVSGMVRERQKQYRATYTKYNVIGACLCILSVIPLFIGGLLSEDGLILASMLSITMLLAGVGAMFLSMRVSTGRAWRSCCRRGLFTEEQATLAGDRSNRNSLLAIGCCCISSVQLFL